MDIQPPFQSTDIPIIIYYKARGRAQIIRDVLLQMNVPFKQVFVSCGGNIPEHIAAYYQLQTKNMPYLIHQKQVLCFLFAILRYLCCRFNRTDLLGIGSPNQIKIIEILTHYNTQKSKFLSWVITQHQKKDPTNYTKEEMSILKEKVLDKLLKMKHFQALTKVFANTRGFLFGQLTILDFIFYEACFHLMGMFGSKLNENCIMGKYIKFFERTTFYEKNKTKLDTYSIVLPDIPLHVNKIFIKIWEGDKKYLNPQGQ